MHCPCCNGHLLILEQEEAELRFCPGCNGAWVDRREFSLLLTPDFTRHIHALSLFSIKKITEPKRHCPVCNKLMKKVVYTPSAGTSVILDICMKNHGIWFDAHELEIVQAAPGNTGQRLTHFFTNTPRESGTHL